MAYNPPVDESIKFLQTGTKDVFPTVFNAGNTSISERYTKVWAEYHNKIRNFIGTVEPLCTTKTAENQGVDSITYWTLNPAPKLNDIIYGASKKAYVLGKAPPTTVFPFEIIITSSADNYSQWPNLSGAGPVPMLYQSSAANVNKICFGNLGTIKPMVTCVMKSTNDTAFSTRWSINSYCLANSDTLVIRGSIIDLNGTGTVTTELPPLSYSFPDGNTQKLFVTLVGVRI